MLQVAGSDVAKAVAVTEAVAQDFECIRHDIGLINESRISAEANGEGRPEVPVVLKDIDEFHDCVVLLDEMIGQLERYMASLGKILPTSCRSSSFWKCSLLNFLFKENIFVNNVEILFLKMS
ncbi:unnamed protein product [Choristocarpus tenellus]